MEIDKNVWRCATELGDTELLAKLSAGDMVAIEAKYHRNCLRALYEDHLHGIAFAELMLFMEDMHADEANAPVFKLSDVANIYRTRLRQLGAMVTNIIHTTRLKDRLLSELPDLGAYSQGRDTILLFEKNVGPALMKACDHMNLCSVHVNLTNEIVGLVCQSYNLNIIYIICVLFQLQRDWLEDSDWTNALVPANIASSGAADSFIRASHVTKTRHAHQVTSATLYALLRHTVKTAHWMMATPHITSNQHHVLNTRRCC